MKTAKERFKEKVNKKGPYPKENACRVHPKIKGTRCYKWTGYCDRDGYGLFWDGQTIVKAHRYAYEQHYGEGSLGKKMCLHKCDNEGCVRLSHLFKGSNKKNSHDKVLKGRQVCKLTEQDVRKIRKLYATGKYSQRFLGKFFGVSHYSIGKICSNKRWKHVR